jgi:phosphoglucomutase/phosphomannomutase
MSTTPPNMGPVLQELDIAAAEGKITDSAVANIKSWLTESRYSLYQKEIVQHILDGHWKALDDAFWTIIPFGTGGRRGRMYGVGSNAINDRTIGESAQGLADMVLETHQGDHAPRCAIAYDTRHKSRHFAELCSSIMVANGFEVYFLDGYRATPQLSYAVREKQCSCGIMVTASHNPPSDNAVKVYWSTGGQVLPPFDKQIIDRVMNVQTIKTVPFEKAVSDGKIHMVTEEIDQKYRVAAGKYAWPGPRDCKLLYTPLHGVGSFAVLPLLEDAHFNNVTVYAPHAEPNGDFPNVPGHVSNPENAIVFEAPIKTAQAQGYDLILATDPDCDRMGAAAPVTLDTAGEWQTFNGNQLGAMLTDFILTKREELGLAQSGDYVIKTLVTSGLIAKIAEAHGARCEGNIHVGFKWIAGLMDSVGPEHFAFGTEESHGYLIGQYARDKDGAVACLLMCQLAATLKSKGISMHQYMDSLYRKHGLHREELINVQMEGSQGMELMQKLLTTFRTSPPSKLGSLEVAQIRDYETLTVRAINGQPQPLDAPKSNMIILDLAEPGNYIAVRPSGTEPKVKFYFFANLPADQSQDLPEANEKLRSRVAELKTAVQAFAKTIS